MGLKQIQDDYFRKIMQTGFETIKPDQRVRGRIIDRMLNAAEKRNPEHLSRFSIMRKPAFAFLFSLTAVLLFSFITLSIGFLLDSTKATNIIILSHTGAKKSPRSLNERTAGSFIKSGDTLKTNRDDMCYLQIQDHTSLCIFPDSEVIFYEPQLWSGTMQLTLNKGAFYYNRPKSMTGPPVFFVAIGEFRFQFEGTRVLLEKSIDEKIQISCYEGKVKIEKKIKNKWFAARYLSTGENIEILKNGNDSYAPLELKNEEQIDLKLKQLPILSLKTVQAITKMGEDRIDSSEKYFRERQEVAEYYKIQKILNANLPDFISVLSTVPAPTADKQVSNAAEDIVLPLDNKKEYDVGNSHVTLIGTMNISSQTDKIRFAAGVSDDEYIYILTSDKLYSLNNDRLVLCKDFHTNALFRIKPIIAGKYLVIMSTNNIYMLDMKTCAIKQTIPLDDIGVCTDNYFPVQKDNAIYFPMQNGGYYRLDFEQPQPVLRKLFSEKFPLSPYLASDAIYVGSFYNKYIASIDYSGQLKWKFRFDGNFYTNFLVVDNNIYAIFENKKKYKLKKIGSDGKEKSESPLQDRVYADLLFNNGIIYGIYTNGNIFSFNIKTEEINTLFSIIHTSLLISDWRDIAPAASDNKLYLGTDNGVFIIYNTQEQKVERRILIDSDAAFFSSPILSGNMIYLISNDGRVFQVKL